jgi:DNA-directed RNA polymerase beta subunit
MSNPPKNTRPFYDPKTLRESIFSSALEGFKKKLNAIETTDFKLQVKNLKIDAPKITTADKKKAVLEKKDLTVPLKGTIELVHKDSGKVVDSKNTTVAQLPYITNHNTVIYNGSEYESVNQQRLLPGVYSRVRQDGIPEAHINPEARTGKSGRILFLPDRQLFILMIKNSQIRLYGILKDLGVQDNVIKEAWGDQIFQVNRSLYKGDEIDKLYSLFIGEE